jgi:hypothetical protein
MAAISYRYFDLKQGRRKLAELFKGWSLAQKFVNI